MALNPILRLLAKDCERGDHDLGRPEALTASESNAAAAAAAGFSMGAGWPGLLARY